MDHSIEYPYDVVVIGASAGGSAALAEMLPFLPVGYPLPLIVVQHVHPLQTGPALAYACRGCNLEIREAEDKQPVQAGFVFFAPANYHLLIEEERTFSLSVDERINFTRPAIDVLFESACEVYKSRLVGIILSGANHDGVAGMAAIKARGGLTIVQEPACAEVSYMPEAVLASLAVDYVLPPAKIGKLLNDVLYRHGVVEHA